jgi:hypothetical protein
LLDVEATVIKWRLPVRILIRCPPRRQSFGGSNKAVIAHRTPWTWHGVPAGLAIA